MISFALKFHYIKISRYLISTTIAKRRIILFINTFEIPVFVKFLIKYYQSWIYSRIRQNVLMYQPNNYWNTKFQQFVTK